MSSAKSDDVAQPWQSYHTVFTNAKAGMDGVDKEKVQKIVYEMSKGSKYFENEQRRETYIQQRIENLRCQAALLTASDIADFEKIADRRVLELEASRDLSRTWIHVDMDAFYAAVETLENPSLAGKPMAVGNMSMICTANYEARKFGVRAAMPGFIARKLYPDLIFVPTNFQKYSHYSELTRKVFREYDSRFIARSLDEAYLDVTDVCRQRCMSGERVAEEIRHAVHSETGLTCSAGVAANRLLAKVCSDINKPNGQYVMPNERPAIMAFLSSLPIRKVSGIGKVTERMLKDVLGINTCDDLLQKRAMVCALFSQCSADFFLSVGLGLGGVEPPEEEHRKSISTERTFPATSDEVEIFKKLDDIANTLSKDMEKEGIRGRTLTLKLKTIAFEVRTRAVSLQLYIYSKDDILHHSLKLLKAELPLSLRLIGLRISHFKDSKSGPSDPTQKTLTSYLTSGNITQLVGSSKSYSDAERDVYNDTEVDGIYSSEGIILGNEIHHDDAVNIDSSNSLLNYYQPKCLVNDLAHRPLTLEHNIITRETGGLECLASEIEEVSAKIENPHANFGSKQNFIEGVHQGNLAHTKGEPITIASDQFKHQSINEGRNQKASSSNSLHKLGTAEWSFKDSRSKVEGDYIEDINESLVCEWHSGSSKRQDKVDLLSGFSDMMFWKDDFSCSLCGFELPASFIEERQEHSDYHLAQMLQEEESPSITLEQLNMQHNKRPRWPGGQPSHGRTHVGKKPGTSQKQRKHVPIDSFFTKGIHHS